jgi:hypothetical protein
MFANRIVFAFAALLLCSLAPAQDQVPVERYNVTRTDDLQVTIRLGADGARGGNQLLLLFQMNNGSTRKFDLNRSREEWAGNSEHRVEVAVQPPIVYADIARIGVEWHGSRGDLLQEQDDVDLAQMTIDSRATGASAVIMNGRRVGIGAIQNVRLENDQTFWGGGVRPLIHGVSVCQSDVACDDGVFCNGAEHCAPGNPNANHLGCVVRPPPCGAGQLCNEQNNSCSVACVDRDGDGHLSASCGGDDCDDNDSNRYPGNVEVLDAADHDEDCDVNTHGFYRGPSSSQICDGRDAVLLVDAREQFTPARCVTGTVCVQQPNGEGVCMVEPPGYQPPTRATAPRGPQQAPPAGNILRIPPGVKPGTKPTPQKP